MNMSSLATATAIAVAGFLATSTAEAATVARYFSQNGGSACTGALPTYEGALRKRPKAIANEGAATAFITCSSLNLELEPQPTSVWAWFTNRGTASATVNCTMITGNEFFGSTAYPMSVVFAPGQFNIMQWNPPVSNDGNSVSLSCALPPGVELNFFNHEVLEEVGA